MFGLAKNFYKWANNKRTENRKMTVVLIGLDNAGKTTVLADFRGDKNPYIAPTVGFSKPLEMKRGKFYVTVYDLGGGVRIRGLWQNYFSDVHGAIFVVDSADTARMDEVKKEFVECFKHPMLQGKPILIFANKQDLPAALDEADISQQMGLNELTSSSHLVVKTIANCEKNGGVIDERIFEGLNWLLKSVTGDYKKLNTRVKSDQQAAKDARAERRAAQAARVAERKRAAKAAAEGKEESKSDAGGASGGASKAAEPDPDVPMCSVCTVSAATGRAAVSKWLPVCDGCRSGLEAGKSAAEVAEAAKAAAGGATTTGGAGGAPPEPEEDAGPKCSVCATRAATKKSAKVGWKPICDECDAELDKADEGGGSAAAADGDAGAGTKEEGVATGGGGAGAGDEGAAEGGAGGAGPYAVGAESAAAAAAAPGLAVGVARPPPCWRRWCARARRAAASARSCRRTSTSLARAAATTTTRLWGCWRRRWSARAATPRPGRTSPS
uniref:ADP-ribosylation factor-like protein 13B n=1 Tax=Bicosoecida sp. CB-2014 TaxID=1486930 RepID=A0A7S1CG51_9STRA|mmetsp:Transcript_2538/g.8686  ORF Transcript_2538/g.8686 Transcript_2538/m.8686 type:complete len:497 (+) Transcript_2538:211-1701(+)